MIFLGIFYSDYGKVTIQEFYTIEALKQFISINKNKFLYFDIYNAKCIYKK